MSEGGPLSFSNVDLTSCLQPAWQQISEMSDLFQLMRFESNERSSELNKLIDNFKQYLPIIEKMLNEADVLLDRRQAIFERGHRKRMKRLQTMEQNYLIATNQLRREAENSVTKLKKVTASNVMTTMPLLPNKTVEEKENLPTFDRDSDASLSPPVRSKSKQIGNLERSVRKLIQAQESKTPTAKTNVRTLMQSAKKSMVKSEVKSSARSLSVSRKVTANATEAVQPSSPVRPPIVNQLTDNEFQSIPQYMRGRAQLHLFNKHVDDFNKVIEMKYKLMSKSISSLNDADLKKHAIYKEQENGETKGEKFCIFYK
jgi:hypothetical protein